MRTKFLSVENGKVQRVKDTDIAHLAGVFDAVGNVALQVVKNDNYKLDYTIRPVLQLRRPEEDDIILGKLSAYCDEQGVKYSFVENTHGAESSSVSIEWFVKGPESIERFLEPMMEYLVSNYFRAELMLDEALPRLANGEHREKEGFYELVGLSDKLREQSAREHNVKYTQEFFEDEWSLSKQ